VPRPNQAFWTLSALWAGWLWGREAVEPYKIALRRRRYDWAWNATALNSAFKHLGDLLPDNTPMFGLLPEPEYPFITSVFTAAQDAGFNLSGVALRTGLDPAQVLWTWIPGAKKTQPRENVNIKNTLLEHLRARGEPSDYLHLHTSALMACANANALKQPDEEFENALRNTLASIETVLKNDDDFTHYSTGEAVDTGMWGMSEPNHVESLSDRVEVAVVTFLQKNPNAIFLDIENEINPQFTGLLTPSKGLIYAVLNSYALKDAGYWNLRPEDVASARRDELNNMIQLLEALGKRLEFKTVLNDKFLFWDEGGRHIYSFYLLAYALVGRAMEVSDDKSIIIMPGGRAGLVAYKQQRDPSLALRMKKYRVVKYRLLRALSEVPILTRETFEEQIASDPVEHSSGQLMMF
jgi:hypothetical protein